jgi:hypothetical protein
VTIATLPAIRSIAASFPHRLLTGIDRSNKQTRVDFISTVQARNSSNHSSENLPRDKGPFLAMKKVDIGM